MATDKKPSKSVAQQHKMGKQTGYTVCPDGSISLAPMHAQKMDELVAEELAVRQLLGHITDHCAIVLRRTSAQKTEWFRQVADDLGIDLREFMLSWNNVTQRLTSEKIVEEKVAPAQKDSI